MEIKDILSELIQVATNQLGERGEPENFDEFHYEEDMEEGYEWDDDNY